MVGEVGVGGTIQDAAIVKRAVRNSIDWPVFYDEPNHPLYPCPTYFSTKKSKLKGISWV